VLLPRKIYRANTPNAKNTHKRTSNALFLFKIWISNINLHILECEAKKSEAQLFIDINFTSPAKAKFEFFKNRFKIVGKGFMHKKDRERNEAFLIRTQKPSMNDQFDHKALNLF
jgi:hypothetical protein